MKKSVDLSRPVFASQARAGTRTAVNNPMLPLSPAGIYYLIGKIAHRAGLSPEHVELATLKPHDIRRTFAQLARDGGADYDLIGKSMGHSSVMTTERYLKDIHDLKLGHTAPDHIRIKRK